MSRASDIWPVTVRSGEVFLSVLMDRKGYKKSLENNTPWIIYPGTGRLLPWPGEPEILILRQSPGGYYMEISENADKEPYGKVFPPDTDPDDRSDMGNTESIRNQQDTENIINNLSDLISERHREMPEGSYTTHLFEKGEEKIRKKTGEEAVELLLAKSREDVIYESADLIYHLLVLLEQLGLRWKDIETELGRRHIKG